MSLEYLNKLRTNLKNGTLNETSIKEIIDEEDMVDDDMDFTDVDPDDYEPTEDELEIITETTKQMMPYIIADEIMQEAYNRCNVDSSYDDAMFELQDHLKEVNLLSESFSMNNPKKNYVKLNKKALIERLRSIIILKMARKKKMKEYKKYKIGQKLRKTNFAKMELVLGNKAGMLAKKIMMSKKKNRIPVIIQKATAKK
jgi:hypothetical protein